MTPGKTRRNACLLVSAGAPASAGATMLGSCFSVMSRDGLTGTASGDLHFDVSRRPMASIDRAACALANAKRCASRDNGRRSCPMEPAVMEISAAVIDDLKRCARGAARLAYAPY